MFCLTLVSILVVGCQTTERKAKTRKRVPRSAYLKPNPIRAEIRNELQTLAQAKAAINPAASAAPAVPAGSLVPAKPAAPASPTNSATANVKKEMAAVKPKPAPSVAPPPQVAKKEETAKTIPEFVPSEPLKRLDLLEDSKLEFSKSTDTPLFFDIPVTYNAQVRSWLRYFQTTGRTTFKRWLERSARYMPLIQYELTQAGLPQDLAYVAMIESGFVPHARSHAGALGMWQFIAPTAKRYGLKIDWWIDERQDFLKSTRAAIRYMSDLYRQFGSWYLVAASYNMGENGVRRLIKKHGTRNFWELAARGALPLETRNYVPKIIASILISKAPALYGFRDLEYQLPLSYETVTVPGGTDIVNLAAYLGVSSKYLLGLNPELLKGFIPREVQSHEIRVPKGAVTAVAQYIRLQASGEERLTATN